MNPCSKVFDREELEFIADLCLKHDAIACATRSTSTSSSTTPASSIMTLPACASARCASARRQELQRHRLEGRLRHGAPRLLKADRQDPSVHDLHHAAQPAVGAAVGLRWRRILLGLAATCSASGPAGHGAWRIGFELLPAHGTYFVTTDFRPLGSTAPTRISAATSPSSGCDRRAGQRILRPADMAPRHSPGSAFASTTRRWTLQLIG
jgi:hypothetical protein